MTHDQCRHKNVLLIFKHPEQCEILEQLLKKEHSGVHTCSSLKTAAMMIDAAQKIDKEYHWLIIHHDLRNIAAHDFQSLLDRQQTCNFNIIFFHSSFYFENLSHFSDYRSHFLPVSDPADFSSLASTISHIVDHAQQPYLNEAQGEQRPQRILLVEDNDIGRIMAKEILEHFGALVSEAQNGAEALDKIRNSTFDLILTDLFMPVMNGLETIEFIRKKLCLDIPIIAMSANAESSWADSLMAGASGYIVKPFESQRLFRELQKWIQLTDHNPMCADRKPDNNLTSLASLSAHIDIQKGLIRAGGIKDFYVRLLSRYPLDFSDLDSRLRTMLNNNAIDEAIHLVHALKGAAGGIAAERLFRRAGLIERQLAAGLQVEDLEIFFTEHRHLLEAIRDLPEIKNHDTTKPNRQGSASELFDLLQKLDILLKTHRARDINDQARLLNQKEWPMQFRESLRSMQKKLEGFQYPEVSAMINQILKSSPEKTNNSESLL